VRGWCDLYQHRSICKFSFVTARNYYQMRIIKEKNVSSVLCIKILFLCPTYDSMGAYSFSVCLFISPSHFNLWIQLLSCGCFDSFHNWLDDWSWCVVHHISLSFWFNNFCRSCGILSVFMHFEYSFTVVTTLFCFCFY
jgi:hypothetical protein